VELRHIRATLALAEELHFGRTAQRLRVAQSAVSQLIKQLEQELGVVLFARTRRSVRLTSAGRNFVDGARRTMTELAETTASTQGIASGETGRLVIQYVPLAALTELPALVASFRRQAAAVEVIVEGASSAEQLEAVRTGRCDLAFVPLAATRRALDPLVFRVMTRDPLVVLVPTRHRFASRRSIRIEDLKGETLVFLSQAGEPQLNAMFRRRCLDAGFDPDIRMEVSSVDALLGFVAAGIGISYVPDLIAKVRYRGVTIVPVRPTMHGGIAAVWHPGLVSGSGRRFLELVPAAGTQRR
jgi:DNA-binding transcriptional LysR family regulator